MSVCKETMDGPKLFRSYAHPSIVQKAKIYRAVSICSKDIKTNNFVVFVSDQEVLVKYRGDPPEHDFDYYLRQSDRYVFIPDGCDKLDPFDYVYFRRLMGDFCFREQISGEIISYTEPKHQFLFISLTYPLGEIVKQKWKEYISGGVRRTFLISPEKIASCFRMFPWEERLNFTFKEDKIEVSVRSSSMNDFKSKLSQLIPESGWKQIKLKTDIRDQYEAFAVARILRHLGKVLPLIGTNCVYMQGSGKEVEEVLTAYDVSQVPTEGVEIFTQESFENMSFLRKASLVKVPRSLWFSFIDLYQTRPQDPYTRKEISPEYWAELDKELEDIGEPFLNGFPSQKVEPQLIVEPGDPPVSFGSTPTLSLYVQFNKNKHFFWQIPDLRGTEYASATAEALKVIVTKWSNQSLFYDLTGFKDIYLIFVPKALYVFEKSSIEISSGLYPRDKEGQVLKLQEQVCILKSID